MIDKVNYHRYPQLLLDVFCPEASELSQIETHWEYTIKKLKLFIIEILGKCDEVMALQSSVNE